MNDKLLALIFGVTVLGALTSLNIYNSGSSSKSSFSIKDIDVRDSLLDAKELAYRVSLFKDWADTHKKQYSAIEAPLRFKTWNKNYDIVQEHNAKNLSWTLEMNLFADLSTEEFSSLHLGFNYNEAAKELHEKSIKVLDESSVAAGIDWRSRGAVGPIRNQGSCGGCYAFCSAAALEGLTQIRMGGQVPTYSPQQILDCSGSYGNQGCNGGLMTYTFQYTQSQGISLESNYPYQQRQSTCRYTGRSAFKNRGFQSVTPGNYNQLQAAVNMQPVAVGVEADQQAFQLYRNGVISSGCGTNLDHAILVVGYTDTYWIVKNQWGTGWGIQGYVYISKGPNNVCGINSMASYPTY